jgi:hypothetical protein
MYINTTIVCVVPTEPLQTARMRRFLETEGLAAGARFTNEIGVFVDTQDPIINITRANWKPGSPFHDYLARFGPVWGQQIYVAHFLTYMRALEWYLRQNPADDACLLMLEDDIERSGLSNRSLSEIVRDAPDFAAFFLQWCGGHPADAVEVGPGIYKGIAAACTGAVAWSPRGIREFLEFANVHGPSVIDVLTEKFANTTGKTSCLYSGPVLLTQAYNRTSMKSWAAADAAYLAWLLPKSELRPSRRFQVLSQRSTEGVIEVDGAPGPRYSGIGRSRDQGEGPHRKKDAELHRDADARPTCFTLPEHFEPGAWRGNWILDRRLTEAFFAPECPFYGDLFPLASEDPGGPLPGNPDQDEHRLVFESHSCNSSSYSSRELRLLLANRTVMFFGDSVSLGMATNLACALWKATQGQHATQHIRAAQDAMEQATEPSRCFKFLDEQIVCWISAATCAKFGSDESNSRFCAETDLRSLGHAIEGASDFLRPSDVVVANAGVQFSVDNLVDQALLFAELEGLCSNVRLWGEAAPLVIWRETAAQNWEPARFPSSPHDSVLECKALPDDWLEAAEPNAWMSMYNPYNNFLEPTLAECAGVRRLPVWLPSAMLGLKDRIGMHGECTHYFGPGSAHGLWNTMLLDVLRGHNTHAHTSTATSEAVFRPPATSTGPGYPTAELSAKARAAESLEQGAARHSERWRGILSLLDGLEALADGSGDVASG